MAGHESSAVGCARRRSKDTESPAPPPPALEGTEQLGWGWLPLYLTRVTAPGGARCGLELALLLILCDPGQAAHPL